MALLVLTPVFASGQDSVGKQSASSEEVLDTPDFNRDIRPILSDKCFTCHGPDEGTREGDLRLDLKESLYEDRGGYSVVVPENLSDSELWMRVSSDDPDMRMPPHDSLKPLEREEIEKLRAWIESGANYQSHWSFEPIVRPDIPSVEDPDSIENPIDSFVVKKLLEHSVRPSIEANRETLIRRLSLDLLGLPPSPADVNAFVEDHRPGAYERLVDRLISSPHFGERWGRHWLDQARYADSHGYTNDSERSMWPYRDWVIESFNLDQPFDDFTVHQLAGDLLTNATTASNIATGFHRNTLINNEGGTKSDQFRVEQAKDRIDTTGLVWMALTIGCAKCHSHKFDPITQHEYYSLYAFFDSTADTNSVAPTISIPTEKQQLRLAELDRDINDLRDRVQSIQALHVDQRASWEVKLREQQKTIPNWETVSIQALSETGSQFEQLGDQSLLVSGDNPIRDSYQVKLQLTEHVLRSIRVRALKHESLPNGGPGRAGNGNFVLAEAYLQLDGERVSFQRAFADHSQPNYEIAKAIDGDASSGWAINGAPEGGPNHNRIATFILPTDLSIDADSSVELVLDFNQGTSPYNLGRFLVEASAQEPIDEERQRLLELINIEPNDRTNEQKKQLDEAFLNSIPEYVEAQASIQSLAGERTDIRKRIPTTMVMKELGSPRETYVHIRGDFLRPGDRVFPGAPDVLPSMSLADGNRGAVDTAPEQADDPDRLDLASWLVDDRHPLTARVRVNRIWMRLFGRGIVETEDDFGLQGSVPSHPELLDWLASEFVAQSWSTKELIRTIVLSKTYRQSSQHREDLAQVDPRNLLLGRQNRLRVEAEVVRDLTLSVSGAFSDRIGGPSVYPPQPDGVYAFTQVNKRWPTSQGADRYRRGMYTFFYRSAPHPMLSTFDVPKFNQTCTRRDRSNTPLQSLTMANDPAMLELAVGLGSLLSQQSDSMRQSGVPEGKIDSAIIEAAFIRCYARKPSDHESERLRHYVANERIRWQANVDQAAQFVATYSALAPMISQLDVSSPDDAFALVELATMTELARVLINLDEFVVRN